MKKLFFSLFFIIFILGALTSSNAHARQFVKFKCLAAGETAEIVIETRERLNVRSLKSSTFTVLIDFDKNSVHFLNNESYKFNFISINFLEESNEEEFFLKGYEIESRNSYDLKINRRNGEFYFLKSWDIELKSYKVLELLGKCSSAEENLTINLKRPSQTKSLKFGEVYIEPQFDTAWDFSEESAAVWIRENGIIKGGHINKNVDVVVPFNYRLIRSFKGGLAGACANDIEKKCGYIDKSGAWIIEPNFNEVWDFVDGFALVTIGRANSSINAKTKAISNEGEKSAYINKKGDLLKNKFFDQAFGFSDGLGSVGNGGARESLWGYVDKTGEQVIPMKFGPGLSPSVGNFIDGIAPALNGHWSNGKYGYINKSGNFIIPPIYKTAADFSEGKASVCRLRKQNNDKKDNTFPELDEKYECSFIDRKGKVLFPFRQYFFGKFRDGLASACRRDTYLTQPSCGFIDARGNMVISERFVQVGDFTNGYARVSVSSKPNLWGLINKKGDFVIKPIFTDLGDVSEGLISFKVGDDSSGKWGYLWAQ
jgi:hypothetical protein